MNPLDAIIGFGSSIANYGAQQSQADEAFRKNKELARMQNGFRIAQWERENLYNTPMQQMMRFKEAGLNPNLIYGQQNLSANSPELVGGTPYQSPQANPIDAQGVAQLSLVDAQKRLIEAQINDLNKGAGLKEKQTENIGFEQYMQEQHLELEKKLADSNIEVNDAEIKNLGEATKKLSEEILNLGVDRAIANLNKDFLEKSMDDRLKMVEAEWKKVNADAALSRAQANRITTLLTQELSNLEAAYNEINSRTDLNQQQKDNLINQKNIEMMDNIYLLTAQEQAKQGHNVRANLNLFANRMIHGALGIRFK